jgi:hypothetical protein
MVSNLASGGKKLYNYWALLAVEFFVWVFWLTTFALYAAFVADTLKAAKAMEDNWDLSNFNRDGDDEYCYADYCVSSAKRSLHKRMTYTDTVSNTIYAALAFSVINL